MAPALYQMETGRYYARPQRIWHIDVIIIHCDNQWLPPPVAPATRRKDDTMAQKAIGVRIGLTNPKFGKTTDPIWTAFPKSFQTISTVSS